MNERELTDWYPGQIEPVREGVYEMKASQPFFARWIRQGWCIGQESILAAAVCGDLSCVQANNEWRVSWRGLRSPA